MIAVFVLVVLFSFSTFCWALALELRLVTYAWCLPSTAEIIDSQSQTYNGTDVEVVLRSRASWFEKTRRRSKVANPQGLKGLQPTRDTVNKPDEIDLASATDAGKKSSTAPPIGKKRRSITRSISRSISRSLSRRRNVPMPILPPASSTLGRQ